MTTIWITTQFQAWHRWLDAPSPVAFLRSMHRHVFHVRVEVAVAHDDRDVEFFMLQKEVDGYIWRNLKDTKTDFSCEHMALEIGCFLANRDYAVHTVTVSEDGENGATIYWKE